MPIESRANRQSGFTLVELAIGIIIIGLLLGTSIMTLSAQLEQRNRSETARLLREVSDALLGFAIANSRLPCPAVGNATGVEAFNSEPACSVSDGFLPAITLSLTPRDKNGYLLDAWGNRIRYAVATHVPSGTLSPSQCPPTKPIANDYAVCPVYTTTQGLLNIGLSTLPKTWAAGNGMLRVCSSICGGTEHAVAATTWSTGRDAVGALENANGDTTYLYPSEGEADDMIVWISQYTLFSRMRAASEL